ncbi:hypothetical protein [Bernardetia sp. MNP-M8]|uniref:hypothetical protein n=1 Tax=Bernardetia sp. MNP-M8 TaxID=3127470 RepID=UPI0030D3E717
MSKRQYEYRIKNWKSKAMARRKENDYLKSRIKELLDSRDSWKKKYQAEKLQGKLNLSTKKAKRHQYSLQVVNFVLELYKYGGMSLRSCRHTLVCLHLCFGLQGKLPSHSSIRNWLCKCGAYRLEHTENQSSEYVVYVDESISFGSEKILLLLGVSVDAIPKNRSLSHSDMEVLAVEIGNEWRGEQIAKELSKIASETKIKYIVSDEGTNLKKAYKSLNYTHIEDCTHILANHLKRLYHQDADFKLFSNLVGQLRQKWNLSKDNSQYMPPSMRVKMRFANIFPCVNWAKKIVQNWDNLPSCVQEQVLFLKEKEEFIKGLIQVEKVFKMVCQELKTTGFGVLQKKNILNKLLLIESQAGDKLNPKAKVFMENAKLYLNNLENKSKSLKEEFILCSSDIIESYFGKFKTKINPNSRSGLTEFIFTIATFGRAFSIEETQNALENIKCKELKLKKIMKNVA